jgi:glycosyltransferase involved in cell wall biosynthesis
VREVLTALAPAVEHLEVIVVNDGSADRTGTIAESLAAADPRVRVAHHATGQGYGGALRRGFAASTGDWVFYTDGDGQIDPAQLPPVLGRLAHADALIGRRLGRVEGRLRRFNGWAWTLLVNAVFGMRFKDVDCAFKVFPGWFVRSVPLRSTGALISAELLARARLLRVEQVRVGHRPRRAGRPTGASPGVILRAVWELLSLARAIRRGE